MRQQKLVKIRKDFAESKEVLAGMYEAESGIDPRMSTDEVLREYAGWLNLNEKELQPHFYEKVPALRRRLHQSFSSKISGVAQRHCPVCHGGVETTYQIPVFTRAIRIRPISKQASKASLIGALERAYRHTLSNRMEALKSMSAFCLALTFVLSFSGRARDRDVDNMSKATLDAFSAAVGIDDSRIHHLDALKLVVPASEEWLYLRIAPSFLNKHLDVVAPVTHHTFAVGDRLDLKDFIE